MRISNSYYGMHFLLRQKLSKMVGKPECKAEAAH